MFIGLQSFGQNKLFHGYVVTSGNDSLAFVEVTLTNDSTNQIFNRTSDFDGYFKFPLLAKGIYTLKTNLPNFKDTIINNLRLNRDTVLITIYLHLCDDNYSLTNCPICRNNDQVIRVVSDRMLVFNKPWSNENQSLWRSRKTRKQGYETFHVNGQEFLFYLIESDNKSQSSEMTLCDQFLFCKQDKKIFKKYTP
jgi:hypothetical protein